jgi:hypothetical protein
MIRRQNKLILCYNTMWGTSFMGRPEDVPEEWEVTSDRTRYREAGVVIFHIPTMPLFRWPLKHRGQRWVALSMESDINYPVLRNRWFMRLFDVEMSYRKSADVRVNYLLPDLPAALHHPPPPNKPGYGVVLFCKNARDRCGRLAYIRELMRHIDVHSYGTVLCNRTLAEDLGEVTKLDLLSRYKFTLAFENSVTDDYVTEKVFHALQARSVPVYRGAQNVDEYLPGDRCMINAHDFAGPRQLAEYLHQLDRDDRAYNKYHAWRHRPLRPEFVDICESQRPALLARLCRHLERIDDQRGAG